MTPDDLLGHLWQQAGLPRACLDAIELNLSAPAVGLSVPSTFKVGLLAQATIAAVACAQVLLEELQRHDDSAASLKEGLSVRRVDVDQREAVLEFASEKYTSESLTSSRPRQAAISLSLLPLRNCPQRREPQ